MQVDGLAGHERGDTIRQGCYEEVKVDGAPRPPAPPPYHHQTCREYKFFADIKQVKAPAVHLLNGVDVLPRDDDKEIEKQRTPTATKWCYINRCEIDKRKKGIEKGRMRRL